LNEPREQFAIVQQRHFEYRRAELVLGIELGAFGGQLGDRFAVVLDRYVSAAPFHRGGCGA
jgi:hypothetical protein